MSIFFSLSARLPRLRVMSADQSAVDDDADRLHVEAAAGQRPDLAHEPKELVEAVVPAREVVVARDLPDHLLGPELADQVA